MIRRLLASSAVLCLLSSAVYAQTADHAVARGLASPTADASNLSATAAGAPRARTLAARAAERYNVVDYGCDPTGVIDCSTILQSLVSTSSGSGVLYFPKGTYKFNSATYIGTHNIIFVDGGVVFTGLSHFNADSDFAVMPNQQASTSLLSLGTGDGNSWGLYVSHVAASGSSGTSSYEKAAVYGAVLQYDNSSALGSPAYTKDAVGVQGNATLAPGVTQGRVFGASSYASVPTGTQGSAMGYEADMKNSSGTDASIDVPGGDPYYKQGIDAVSTGSNMGGAAFLAQSQAGAGKWRVGFESNQTAINDYFLLYDNLSLSHLFSVDGAGNELAQSVTLKQTTVVSLPTCSAGNKGMIEEVTDATSPSWHSTLAGGGTAFSGAMCNGAAWIAF